MLVDFLDPCPTCGGSGVTEYPWHDPDRYKPCPSCVGGRVVSESVIEEMGEAMWDMVSRAYPWNEVVRAGARVVLEHMEDNERTTG